MRTNPSRRIYSLYKPGALLTGLITLKASSRRLTNDKKLGTFVRERVRNTDER